MECWRQTSSKWLSRTPTCTTDCKRWSESCERDQRQRQRPARTWTSWCTLDCSTSQERYREHSRTGRPCLLTSMPTPVSDDELDITLGRQLYYILVSLTSDTARSNVAKAPRREGLTVWCPCSMISEPETHRGSQQCLAEPYATNCGP